MPAVCSAHRAASPRGRSCRLFCNLYLHRFDVDLAKGKIPFVRYADDFLLFAPEREPAERALAYATERLQRFGLDIHPEKTQVVESNPELYFLGERLPRPGYDNKYGKICANR